MFALIKILGTRNTHANINGNANINVLENPNLYPNDGSASHGFLR